LKIIGEDGSDMMWANSPVISTTECFLSADQVRRVILKYGFWFTGQTVICRREYIVKDKDTDVFDPELYQFADHLEDIILATRHGACFIPEVLATWRTYIDKSGYADVHFLSEDTKTNSAVDKMFQIMNSKEYRLLIPRDFVKQYIHNLMYSLQSMRLNKINNEMNDFMKNLRNIGKSQSLLDKLIYLIINMLNKLKIFFVKSYIYYSRTHINVFSFIRLIVSYRRGLKIYKNSKRH
jgi:hypothetical protein